MRSTSTNSVLLIIPFFICFAACDRTPPFNTITTQSYSFTGNSSNVKYLDQSSLEDSIFTGYDYINKQIDIFDFKNRSKLFSMYLNDTILNNKNIRRTIYKDVIWVFTDSLIVKYDPCGDLIETHMLTDFQNDCKGYRIPRNIINNFRSQYKRIESSKFIFPIDLTANRKTTDSKSNAQFGIIDFNNYSISPIIFQENIWEQDSIDRNQLPIFDVSYPNIYFIYRTIPTLYIYDIQSKRINRIQIKDYFAKIRNNDIIAKDKIREISLKVSQSLFTGLRFDPIKQTIYIIECAPINELEKLTFFNREFRMHVLLKSGKTQTVRLKNGIVQIPYIYNSKIYFQKKNNDFKLEFIEYSFR